MMRPAAVVSVLVSLPLEAEVWTKAETSHGELLFPLGDVLEGCWLLAWMRRSDHQEA